jgi:anti-sigma B factor antagonist
VLDHDRAASRLGQLCSMRVARTPGTVLIQLHGEFDCACVERFEQELTGALDGEAEMLVLDLRGLEFIDTSGLRMLVVLTGMTTAEGRDYAVVCEDGAVRRVLEETGLDGVLPLASDATVPRSDPTV